MGAVSPQPQHFCDPQRPHHPKPQKLGLAVAPYGAGYFGTAVTVYERPVLITVTKNGTGSGRTTSCGSGCTTSHSLGVPGAVYRFDIEPDHGSTFAGARASNGQTCDRGAAFCIVTLGTDDLTLTMTFDRL